MKLLQGVFLEWVSVRGTPEVFVSDGAPHFKNETLMLIAAKLGSSHQFPVAYSSSWSNGTTVKRLFGRFERL